MDTKTNIKDLGITLSDLYEGKKQLNLHVSNKPFTFSIVLKDNRNKVDCKISSFGANLWFRTNKGLNYEKYNSLGSLQSAIKRATKNKLIDCDEITFSLSDEVYTF